MTTTTVLPARSGARPEARQGIPHQQLSQIAPVLVQEALWVRMAALPQVTTGPSGISLPETRALQLPAASAGGPREAFLIGHEFAHLHGETDGSLHLALPLEVAAEVEEKGWGELHPAARMGDFPHTLMMLYGPRDDAELEVIWRLVQLSHQFALGSSS